jgi:UDP-glucuronate decarboxylase
VKVFGDGTQTRSYCYISDLVDAITTYASKGDLSGSTINLGNTEERTVLETAQIIHSLIVGEGEPKMEFSGLPLDDPLRRKPDISLAKQLLGWEPKISFKDGLMKTIEYYKNQS